MEKVCSEDMFGTCLLAVDGLGVDWSFLDIAELELERCWWRGVSRPVVLFV